MAAAITLADDFAVPLEAERLQGAEDTRRRTRDFARPIEIFEPQQPASSVCPRVEVARRRRIQRTQMQIARGCRGETAYIRRRSIGTCRRGRRTAFRGVRAAPALPPTMSPRAWLPIA